MRFSKVLLTSVILCLAVMQSMADTVSGVVENAQGGPLANGTFTFTLTQPVVLSGTATIVPSQVNCYTDSQGNVVGLPTPAAASLSTNLGSGTLPAGTYYIKTAWANSTGTSEASSEQTQILASQGTLIVTAPANKQPASATQYKVYIGSTSGGETLQGTVTISGGTFAPFQQSTGLAAGSAVPVSNTSVCSIHFNDEFQPSFVCYNVGLTTQSGITVPGYPQYWYLAGGTSGTVNLSQGTPQSNVCQGQGVVYPQAILAMPQFGVTQTIGGGLIVGGDFTATGRITGIGVTTGKRIDILVAGAKCDGTSDDSGIINAAIASASATGAKVIFPSKTCAVASSILPTNGTTLEGIACSPSETGNTPCGTVLKWTGAVSTPVIKLNDASHVSITGVNIDCNSISGCIGEQFYSDNAPSASYAEFGFQTIWNAHIGQVFGDSSAVASVQNFQADIVWSHDIWIRHNCTDLTAESVRINSQNTLDQSTMERYNVQCANVAFHEIKGPLQTFTLKHFNAGSPVGVAPTQFRMESTNCVSPRMEGDEVEGVWTHAIVDHSTCSQVLMAEWVNNQFNQPGDVTIDGNELIVSSGNSGGNAGTWVASNSAFVVSLNESFPQWSNNGHVGGWDAATAPVLAIRSPWAWVTNSYSQGGTLASGNVGYYAQGAPGLGTGTTQLSFDANSTSSSAATAQVASFASAPATASAAFTVPKLSHFLATDVTLGAGSAVTEQNVFECPATLTGGATNFCINNKGSAPNNLGGGTTNIGTVAATGPLSKINNITTILNGTTAFVAKADLTGQTANVGSTLLYAVPASGAGFYRVTGYVVITTAAGTSSTLPAIQIAWTDNETNVAASGQLGLTSTNNTVGATNTANASQGQQQLINAKASTNINFSTAGYASNPASAMTFSVHIKLEYIGN